MFLQALQRRLRRASDRRRYRRITGRGHQLTLAIDGQRLSTRDWSLGGLRIDGIARRPGERLSGRIECGGAPGGFSAEVVRVDPGGTIAARFIEVSSAIFLTMAAEHRI